ncbi:hypothetical protein DXG01_012332 [Tephrocybe rancida]|nr:hypothetical protein DXG01_012332 [Tephrocybe rancida]
MSLDQNLFTLHVTQNKDNPHVIDLIDPSGTIHYTKHRLPGNEYKVEVYDPTSQSLLITATAPMATSKAKTLELYNPTILVDLKFTGTLSFRWNFKWEEHEFEWKREQCFMLRKPDPPVLVAVTKEPAGRLKTTTVQILDYNLNRYAAIPLVIYDPPLIRRANNRFDIDDRKGLEIVILTALLTFSDVNEGYHMPQETSRNVAARTNSALPTPSASPSHSQPVDEAPPPPPKPAPKTGVDRIAEMQAALGEYNELTVGEEGQVDHYAEYCTRLLEDDAMLFVTIRSAAAEQVPKVLQVVEQYVLYDTEKKKGPRRIKLDDNVKPATTYTPPTSLTVHLSKIDMPELQPKPTHGERPGGSSPRESSSHDNSHSPGKDKPTKDSRKKEEKKAPRPTTPPTSSYGSGSSSGGAKVTKTGRSSSPAAYGYAQAHARVHAHQMHPNQPSPSPSQLNNPSIYTAPHPPRPPNSYSRSRSPTWEPPPPSPYQGSAQAFYGPGSYVPPHQSTSPSSPYPPPKPGYAPSYAAPPNPPSYLPPPPPAHPQASSRPPSPPPAPKPSVVSGLLDSFRRR